MNSPLKPLPKTDKRRLPSAGSDGRTRHADSALDDLASRASVTKCQPLAITKPLLCPCCKQAVTVPSLEIVVDAVKATPLEAKILGAIWKGKGMPVATERVFDAMYADDPDGGPTPSRMYAAFKVALCHLRTKLRGSGLGVENVGYRQGYRLIMEMKG
jgi:hypothetical protein